MTQCAAPTRLPRCWGGQYWAPFRPPRRWEGWSGARLGWAARRRLFNTGNTGCAPAARRTVGGLTPLEPEDQRMTIAVSTGIAGEPDVISFTKPRSPAAEAYRTLRTNIEFASV